MSAAEFEWPVRVYYEDTDAAGIVYHANYLRFMERARTEWLRALGFEQDELRNQLSLVFVITRSDVRYLRPARFNDALVVRSRLKRLRRASFEFTQRVVADDDVVTCEANNEIACVDAERMIPRRIPPPLMEAFSRVQ